MDGSPVWFRVVAYGKDAVGLVGTVLTAFPFFRDRSLKKDINEATTPGVVEGAEALAAFEAIANKLNWRFFSPDGTDFWLFVVGLALIALSFILSLVVTAAS